MPCKRGVLIKFWGGLGEEKNWCVLRCLLCVPFGVFSSSAPVYGVCCAAVFAGVVHFDYSAGFAFFFVS